MTTDRKTDKSHTDRLKKTERNTNTHTVQNRQTEGQ